MVHKTFAITTCVLIASFLGCRGSADTGSEGSASLALTNQVVEISCGQCQFEMEGSGCDLAIRHEGQCYFVAGSNIDDHGDAHAEDGLCNCVRSAKVTGKVVEDKFVADQIDLINADAAN